MAKLFGINTKLSGKVGQYVFVQSKKHGTIVYEAPARLRDARRSYKQMSTRTQWANLGATYKLFDDMLKRGFEELPANMTSYNAFVQANLGTVKVYITNRMRKNGGCVLAPYQITEGSLPSIRLGLNGSGILVSGLQLGSLTITASTTLAQFSEALIANNPDWQEGDQLTFFHGVQLVNPITGYPYAELRSHKVMLDTANPTPLWDVTGSLGFTSVPEPVEGTYRLGMSQTLTDGAAVWVHSRETDGGKLRVSTQYFYVENAALAAYQTLSALNAATDSYGGINTDDVYLRPDENTNTVAGHSSSSATDNAGGNSGGSSGGNDSQVVTVAAPVISGSTPFEESTQVTMSCSTTGAAIHYTTDGSTPTSSSTQYTEALTLSDTTTVKAIAVKGTDTSTVSSRTFTKGDGEDVS